MKKAFDGLGLLRGRFSNRAVFVLVSLLAFGAMGCSSEGAEAELPFDDGTSDAGGLENDAGG